jgi:hypothetical protein
MQVPHKNTRNTGVAAAPQLCILASKVALNFHKYLACMPFFSFNLSLSAIFLSISAGATQNAGPPHKHTRNTPELLLGISMYSKLRVWLLWLYQFSFIPPHLFWS